MTPEVEDWEYICAYMGLRDEDHAECRCACHTEPCDRAEKPAPKELTA